jgi:hypothetical protein
MTDVRGDIRPPSGWVGIAVFGGLMLLLAGMFQVTAGLVGISDPSHWRAVSADLVIRVDYAAWGWAHLALGVFAIVTSVGVMTGRRWGRVAGISLAGLSSLVNLMFLAAHPVWATMIIVFDVLVIYALAVHGDEIRT